MYKKYIHALNQGFRKKNLKRLSVTVAIAFFAVAQSSATLLAQPNLTLNRNKATIKEVFNEIKNQTEYTVFYSTNLVNENLVVSANFANKDVKEVLNEVLKDLPLTYVIKENTIVIKERTTASTTSNPNSSASSTVGYVQHSVRGVVRTGDGQPLEGVSVTIKGTRVSAITNADGSYLIAAGENDILVFSSVGYKTTEQAVQGRNSISIQLAEDITGLDEVMVVAFGTVKKSTYTGSASVIGEETFSNRPITEVTQALTGTTPGLMIGTSNGQPGSAPTIRIRGIGSFNAGNSPLIILDGMPYDNAFSSINPTDIESVTVLKDASSAALYGSRGANGVLLITTKKGNSAKPKVDVKYNFGLTQRQSTDYEVLGDKDYMELYWETLRNGYVFNGMPMNEANALAGPALIAGLSYNPYLMDPSELFTSEGKLNPNAVNHWADDTDWYGGITQLGKRHDGNFSISGKNENTDYYTSLGYLDEQGFIIGSGFNRISGKANVNSQVAKWLKVGVNLNVAQSEAQGEQNESSGSISNPFRATRFIGNIFPIHLHDPATGAYILDASGNKIPDWGNGWTSEDGSINISGRDGFANSNHPFEVHNTYSGYRRQTLNLKGFADISFTKDLKLSINGGLGTNMYRSWNGGYVYPEKGNAGSSSKNTSNTSTWTFQQILNYDKSFGDHNFSALVGHESYQYEYHYMSTSMKTQSIFGDNFEYANFTEINALPNSYTHNYRVEGIFSRVNYDFNNKYYASASYRKDGSSRFYKDVRWGDFWSVGAGWSLDREAFLQEVDEISTLRVRASYGVVGNDDLSGYYPWRATYAPNDNGEPGYIQSSLGNMNLTWETSKNFDAAVEFGLFRNRIEGSVEYFNRVSSDLLFSVPKPISSGISNVDVNAGSMYNKGVEVTLSGDVVRTEDFRFGLEANATYIKNRISELPLDPYNTSVYRIEEGHSRYDFWLRQWYGVNPETGYNLFKADTEQYDFAANELIEIDGVQYTENVEKALYEFSGSAMPKVTGGFGANVGWKNFNLKFNFYYQLGGKFYDNTYSTYMSGSLTYFKQHKDLLNRWQKPGDITDVARVTSGTDRTNIGAASSTRWLTTSNMLELTNINLSYNVPSTFLNKYNISQAAVYFSADNVYLLSDRKGMYPRRSFYSGYIGNSDVYPPSAIMSFGLSFTF